MAGQGLARGERLPDARAFARVFAKAHRSRDRHFTVLARSGERVHARVGLVVSKRIAKHAVQRNRLKRLVRESFRGHKAELRGLDVVVIAKPAAVGADNATLLAVLKRHWSRLAHT